MLSLAIGTAALMLLMFKWIDATQYAIGVVASAAFLVLPVMRWRATARAGLAVAAT